MWNGLLRSSIAAFLMCLVLVLSVPRHYLHACHDAHAPEAAAQAQDAPAVSADHHCAICELVLPTYTTTAEALFAVAFPVVMDLGEVAHQAKAAIEAERSGVRGPPLKG